jgi:hypothetical protein
LNGDFVPAIQLDIPMQVASLISDYGAIVPGSFTMVEKEAGLLAAIPTPDLNFRAIYGSVRQEPLTGPCRPQAFMAQFRASREGLRREGAPGGRTGLQQGALHAKLRRGALPAGDCLLVVDDVRPPDELLVKNDLNRYLINSPMLPDLKTDPEGGLTICVQCDPPGADKTASWLPASKCSFMLTMRYFLPKPELLSGPGSCLSCSPGNHQQPARPDPGNPGAAGAPRRADIENAGASEAIELLV